MSFNGWTNWFSRPPAAPRHPICQFACSFIIKNYEVSKWDRQYEYAWVNKEFYAHLIWFITRRSVIRASKTWHAKDHLPLFYSFILRFFTTLACLDIKSFTYFHSIYCLKARKRQWHSRNLCNQEIETFLLCDITTLTCCKLLSYSRSWMERKHR